MSNRLPSDAPKGAKKRTLIPKGEYFPSVFSCFDMEKKVIYSPEQLQNMGVFCTSLGHFVATDNVQRPLKRLQFSGLKDSDGRMLFEGDVCKLAIVIDMGIGIPANIEKWGVMRWVKGGFSFVMPDIMGQKGAFEVVESHYQGNELVNPELLDNLITE